MKNNEIIIKGAREHNLKNIDVTIPRDKLVVITGLSGSGKSSLAFDTIYAEGQRRYVESLSAYARQFLEQMEKPDVESIEGLSPAISIEQKTTSKNPRSTVGTVTEIYDYLRLLFARIGHPHCYKCSREIVSQTVSQMVDRIMGIEEGAKLLLMAPVIKGRKGEYRKEFDLFRKDGFVRVRVDGEMRELSEEIVLDKKKKHTIEVVVDRLVVKEGIETRLADSLETALKLADGIVLVEEVDGESHLFSEQFACISCGISYPEITPRMFSFNNPYGACSSCDGLGTKSFFDPHLIVPNPAISIRDGAIRPWEKKDSIYYHHMIEALSKYYSFDIYAPYEKLSQKVRDILIYGSGTEEVEFFYEKNGRRFSFNKPFEGIIENLSQRYRETDSDSVRDEIERYMNIQPCPDCHGSRLKRESLSITIDGRNVSEITRLSIADARRFFEGLGLSDKEEEIARRILKEIRERLAFLINVGLDYLSLDRTSGTLSGGEGQRIRLATQIGSSLVGVLYILDEPSIGLHQRDNARLIDTLRHLRDLGNTVLVVEHDEDTILASDYVLDMGPGAGVHGGEVIAQGTPEEILRSKESLTGRYLSGDLSIAASKKRRPGNGKAIVLKGARGHNLKDLDVSFPLGKMSCITGVSGSGKSTLIIDTLYKTLAQRLYHSREMAEPVDEITGIEHIDKVIDIDQAPIGRTPRSNPATYTGVFTPIRELFTQLPEAKARGYKPGRFSFNVKGGRCEACAGDGIIKIEMHFLPDVYVQCEVCKGHRYNRETLEVRYKGKNIADVLEMTVSEGLDFFKNIPVVQSRLETLSEVGLGYVQLGQAATTLSGGEAQRVKLSKELSKRGTGKTLYILDEPTTGLHFADIQKLLDVLNRLADAGNTILIIEHNLDVIKTADHIIDLGPEGGSSGGEIVVQGTPEEVAACKRSHTGEYLKPVLEKS
ncbi:MAG: excinuclease ABC subunit UvrA [Proteobacteria bacterium]|nr:excinuclease ABC subunit UvrA [Pseudomonadota bacterium]